MTTVRHYHARLRDRAALFALRGLIALQKDMSIGPQARTAYDGIIGRMAETVGMSYEVDAVGGVLCRLCRSAKSIGKGAILYFQWRNPHELHSTSHQPWTGFCPVW